MGQMGRTIGGNLDCNGRRNSELAGGIASNLRGTLANPSASVESIQSLAADLDWRCDRLERSLSRFPFLNSYVRIVRET